MKKKTILTPRILRSKPYQSDQKIKNINLGINLQNKNILNNRIHSFGVN